ncbi:MAG TPA: hypothetical protein VEV17_22495 [Bryobacteraceae bacterium]|nr:hypothetical protein [Bryobacteraceae bacterium]
MSFPDDLLELAQHLADLYPDRPHQASFRRAVSTAYYALFHLLISDATANWARPELRAMLARCFDHGPMKTASKATIAEVTRVLKANPPEGREKTAAMHLRTVANAFIQAQQQRNDADYNIAKEWTPLEVASHLALVSDAFRAWKTIRDEPDAQAYLVLLLGPREGRPNQPKPSGAGVKRKKKLNSPGAPPRA